MLQVGVDLHRFGISHNVAYNLHACTFQVSGLHLLHRQRWNGKVEYIYTHVLRSYAICLHSRQTCLHDIELHILEKDLNEAL